MKNYAYYEVDTITSIKDMIANSVKKYGDKDAMLIKKKTGEPYTHITYKQLDKDIEALGTAFLDLNLSGEKIALLSETRYEWYISYLGTVNGESIVVPIDKELPSDDWKHLLEIANVSAVVYSKKFSEDMKKAKEEIDSLEYLINMDLEESNEDELSVWQLVKDGCEKIENGDTRFKDVKIDVNEARILLFTSGTTAMSKGVLHSHKTITTNLMNMCKMTFIGNDIFLSVLPIHHTYECTCGFLCPLYRGCTIAQCEGLKYILKNISEAKPTMILGVPAIFEVMYKRIWATAKKNGIESKLKFALKLSNGLRKIGIDLRRKLFKQVIDNFGGNLRLLISGAAAINPDVSKGFEDLGVAFLQGYGITECAPIVALNRDKFYKHDSAGYPCVGMELKIENPDSEGIGELICKGDNVMLGYYENEEATNEVLKDGWFYTGDLAYMDEDGFVHITGRKKNVIIASNGKNVFPEELETFLNEDANILESMVYQDGEDINAIIVPNYEYIKEANPDATKEDIEKIINEVVDALNKRNPLYKYIRNVEIRDTELIKTTTKKIKRYEVIKK